MSTSQPLGTIILFKDSVQNVTDIINRMCKQYRLRIRHIYRHAVKGFSTGPIPTAARTQILRQYPSIHSIHTDVMIETTGYSIVANKSMIREGETVTYTVTATGVKSGTVLYWQVVGTTADFSGPVSGSVKVTGTTTSATGSFSVTALVDSILEGNETFYVVIRAKSSSTSTILASTQNAPTTIQGQIYTITTPQTSYVEGTAASFTISSTGIAAPRTIYWTIVGTASAADFTTPVSGSVSVADASPATITLQTIADYITEGNEQFYISVRQDSLTGTELTRSPTITIIDKTVTISTPTTTYSEGDSIPFTVTTSGFATATTAYWTIVGTATASDFSTPISGSISIADTTPVSITLQSIADYVTEGNEQFYVSVRQGSLTGTEMGRSPIVTIVDKLLTISTQATTYSEGSTVPFTITSSGFTTATTAYWTIVGTASTADFVAPTSGSISILDTTPVYLSLQSIADFLTEGNEQFYVSVRQGSLTGTEMGRSPTVTILDTPVPVVSVSTPATTYGEGVTAPFTLTSFGFPTATTVYWTIVGTASAADFVGPTSGSISVSDTSSASISLPILADYLTEGTEQFYVSVRQGSLSGTELGRSPIITILDTSIPVVSISTPASSYTEGDTMTFTISSKGFPTATIFYWTVIGTGMLPTSTADFSTPTNGTISLTDTTSVSIQLQAIIDFTIEGNKQFYVSVCQGSSTGPEVCRTPTITILDGAIPTFVFSSSTNTLTEDGTPLVITVTCNNYATLSNTLQWGLVGLATTNTNAASAADFVSISGDIPFVNSVGTISVAAVADQRTEGTESFYVSVKNGLQEVARSPMFYITDTSQTPPPPSGTYYTLTTDKTALTEELIYNSTTNASQLTCTVTSNAPVGTVVFWELSGTQGPIADYDFMDSYGYVTLDSTGKASFRLTALNDRSTESTEPFYIKLRTGPGSYGLALSSQLTLADTPTILPAPTGCLNSYSQQIPWGITNIKATQNGLANRNGLVDIYVIDTGCSSQDLNIRDVRSFITDTLPLDGNGHGTHCAGTAAAINNTTGVVGVIPNANLFAYKALSDTGSGSLSNVVAAVDFICGAKSANRRSVISMSLGAKTSQITALDTALQNAINTFNIVGVVSAGNGASDASNQSPAHLPEAITVGAYDSTNTWASFSNYGSLVDILAPGVSVDSLYSEYGTSSGCMGPYTLSGTSMATPHVAGAAALYLAKNPVATPQQVRDAIVVTADANVTGIPTTDTTNRAVNIVNLLA